MSSGVELVASVIIMKDCFGVEYALVGMPGNGLCGYSSLAYALLEIDIDMRKSSKICVRRFSLILICSFSRRNSDVAILI